MASRTETQSERRARISAHFAQLGNDAFADDAQAILGAGRAAPSSERGSTSASSRIPMPALSAPSAPSAPIGAPMIPLPSEAQAQSADAECDGCKLVHVASELRHDARWDGTLCSSCLQSAERAQARLLAAQMPKLPRRGATQFQERHQERYLKLSESAYRDWRRAPSAETTMALIRAIGARMDALSCSESEAHDG